MFSLRNRFYSWENKNLNFVDCILSCNLPVNEEIVLSNIFVDKKLFLILKIKMAISCNLLLNKLVISARASKSLYVEAWCKTTRSEASFLSTVLAIYSFVTSHTPDPPMWSAMDWSESTLPGDSINGLAEKGTESLHLWRIHSSRRKQKGDFLAFWTSTVPRSHLESLASGTPWGRISHSYCFSLNYAHLVAWRLDPARLKMPRAHVCVFQWLAVGSYICRYCSS